MSVANLQSSCRTVNIASVKMKSYVLFGIVALAACAIAEERYTDKFDNTNVQEILSNKRLLVSYIKCGLDQAPCTPEGKELKAHIKEGLETRCAKCTEKQKSHLEEVFRHLIHNEKAYWEELVNKYDPQRTYSKKYEEDLKKVSA